MSDVAIKFENISKQYRLGLVSTKTLSHDLNRWWQINILKKEDPYLKIGEVNDRATKGSSEYVWALRNIDFEVKQGDVLGIIGKNGAGKSTLLKILSRVTTPTTGTIKARGRIASLLEVGTGFHGEMTGLENIYMNGAILGMNKAEIKSKLDEIVDFSGVERYLDTPVKRYSSGMTVRLGFAIAAHLDPEILVVDEVLAVGDAEFQKKAIGKMQDVSKGEGRTVLFVSHNMASIKALCKTGILLQNGNVNFDGKIDDVVDLYLKEDIFFQKEDILSSAVYNKNSIQLYSIELNGNSFNQLFLKNGNYTIRCTIRGKIEKPTKMDIEAKFYDNNRNLLAVYSPSHITAETPLYPQGKFEITNEIRLPDNITHGEYRMEIRLAHPNVEYIAIFKKPIMLNVEGITAANGRAFEYKNCGLLMLK
jgi:lipopolysaccharide transport system ATP-binding protein